jgi:hypothetical protein
MTFGLRSCHDLASRQGDQNARPKRNPACPRATSRSGAFARTCTPLVQVRALETLWLDRSVKCPGIGRPRGWWVPRSWWARVGEKYRGMGAGDAYLVCDHGLTLPSEILRNRDSAFSAGPFLLHDIGLNAEQNPYGVSRDSRAARRIATTVRRNGNFRRRRQSTRADFFAATVVLYRALRLPNELECGFAVTINPPFGTSMLLRADLVKMW